MIQDSRVLSDGFVRHVRRNIKHFYWTHPVVILVYVLIFLFNHMRPSTRMERVFVPKYVLARLEHNLISTMTSTLGTIARIRRYSGGEEYLLWDGVFGEDFVHMYEVSFVDGVCFNPELIPGLFELLYLEVKEYAGYQTMGFWHLEQRSSVIYLCWK